MLGRIGSGSAIAALPLGGLAIAVADDRCLEAWLCLAAIAAILLVTFAPWIPGLRKLLPSYRRMTKLNSLWTDGKLLQVRAVTSDAEYVAWEKAYDGWQEEAVGWIKGNISQPDALRFRWPSVTMYQVSGSYSERHSEQRNLIGHQLPELIRLRDAEKPR